MIVTMAVLTTCAMPPTLRWALARVKLRRGEKDRLEREAYEAKGFVANMERLLLTVSGDANGRFASRLAGLLAGPRGLPITLLQFESTPDSAAEKAIIAEKAGEMADNIKSSARSARQQPSGETNAL